MINFLEELRLIQYIKEGCTCMRICYNKGCLLPLGKVMLWFFWLQREGDLAHQDIETCQRILLAFPFFPSNVPLCTTSSSLPAEGSLLKAKQRSCLSHSWPTDMWPISQSAKTLASVNPICLSWGDELLHGAVRSSQVPVREFSWRSPIVITHRNKSPF